MPLTKRSHVDFLHSQTWLTFATHLYRVTAILRWVPARGCLSLGRAVHRPAVMPRDLADMSDQMITAQQGQPQHTLSSSKLQPKLHQVINLQVFIPILPLRHAGQTRREFGIRSVKSFQNQIKASFSIQYPARHSRCAVSPDSSAQQ